jgi:hypothetical protein
LQGKLAIVVTDVGRKAFAHPLFQFHCLGQALFDRKHHSPNCGMAILVPCRNADGQK